ncbi:MAG: hypothetical protein V1787_05005 [Candidatus Micrarchaeota archaeon]
MDVNQIVVYGFVLTLAFFAIIAYQAHKNLREVLAGLKDVNSRAGKLDKAVSGMTDDVRQLKAGIAKKVEKRSLERIMQETVEFIERNAPVAAVAENRVARRR